MGHDEKHLNINEALHHIELQVEDSVAFIEYKLVGKTLFLIHTEVPKALEGKGVGTAIVQKTLEYARHNQYQIVPICPFIQAYLKRHPEWNEIVAPNADRFINKQ